SGAPPVGEAQGPAGLGPGAPAPIRPGAALAASASLNSGKVDNAFQSASPSFLSWVWPLARPAAMNSRNCSTLSGPYSLLSPPIIWYMTSPFLCFGGWFQGSQRSVGSVAVST